VYGPIKANETLRHIAGRLQPSGVTKEQMMIALLARNPRAFNGNNINQLRQGAILIEPPRALFAKISRAAAAAEVRQQMTQWRMQNQ
jgi:pilus assembly protein FimV